MNVAVFGAGGVGGYFGGRLAQAGADVHLIARGAHLRALQKNGLRVESVHGDFAVDLPAMDDPGDVGPCDVVLLCVKSFDTDAAVEAMGPLLGDDTVVLSLQNGVDNEETLAAEIGRGYAMGGVAYIFSTIKEPGVIEHTGGPAELIFGELDGDRSHRARRVLEWCDRAPGMDGTLSADIWVDLWEKYAFICAESGVTAAVRRPIGEIRAIEASWALYEALLHEAVAVAAAEGVDLSGDTVDKWLRFAQELEPDTYSSLHYDMTNGKPMELEALHGTLVEKAGEHGVEVPRTETIYAVLRPWAVRNARA